MIRKIANKFGYELIKTKKSPTLWTHLNILINNYNINLVLDVGANKGQFSLKLRDINYKNKIISFEPVHNTYLELLEASKNDNNWNAVNIALGNENGNIVINNYDSSDLSSILKPNKFGKDLFPKLNMSSAEEVEVRTLDNFLSKIENDKNRVLGS